MDVGAYFRVVERMVRLSIKLKADVIAGFIHFCNGCGDRLHRGDLVLRALQYENRCPNAGFHSRCRS